jgi:hypothetical protein
MTQAMNLANFSNSLDSAGGVPPTQLNSVVPLSKGGTNASTASAARTNLGLVIGTDIPAPNGTGSTGTWPISVTGSSTNLTTTNFAIFQSGSNLVIQYGGSTIVTISSAGAITANSTVSGN